MKLQEKEWFAERSPEIADAPNAAARKRIIRALEDDDPELHRAFIDALRQSEGWSHLMRNSGRYPLCARGDINSYAVFAEGMRSVLNERGRVGCVLPTGIATDDTTKFFFQDVVGTRSLVSLFDFENKGVFFPDVHSSYKFCLFTAGRGTQPAAEHAEYVFFAHAVDELRDPERRFTLSPDDIALLNPNTRTCPTFRSRSDAELAKAIYRRVPVLVRKARDGQPEENPWAIRFSTMFHMSNDSHLFRTREQLEADGWELAGNVFQKNGNESGPPRFAQQTPRGAGRISGGRLRIAVVAFEAAQPLPCVLVALEGEEMILVDGPEKVRQRVANCLREELLPLPVKQQPAIGDFVLRLHAKEDGVPR